MKVYQIYELLEEHPDTGLIIEEENGSCHCQLLVGTLPVILYQKLEDRDVLKIFVKDNNLHIVLEEK